MDLSDLSFNPGEDDQKAARPENSMPWHSMIRQIGREVAEPLTSALDRVTQLAETGRIDRQSLRLLRVEIERARHAAILSQQLARLTSGSLQQSRERLPLPQVMKDLLTLRQRDLQARGITVRPVVASVDVLADPALLFAMLDAALDWAMTRTRDLIQVKVDQKLWPKLPRVRFRFSPKPESASLADEFSTGPGHTGRDLDWCLVEQAALAMDVKVQLGRESNDTVLSLEFPSLADDAMEGMSVVELDRGFASSDFLRPVAGSHVLVVAARRAVRIEVRESIASMGLVVDFVNSVEEAVEFCAQGVPHAVIVESVLRGERFDLMRAELLARSSEVVFIELMEEGSAFEISGFSGSAIAKVGRDVIATSLPQALAYELSHAL